jgi:hypothetical protein
MVVSEETPQSRAVEAAPRVEPRHDKYVAAKIDVRATQHAKTRLGLRRGGLDRPALSDML